MAATSMMTARLRPGFTGMVITGTRMPRISVYSLSMPMRSWSLVASQISMLMHMSIFSDILMAPMPKMRRALMMPTPRSSMKWRMFSGARPTKDLLDTRRISTASSAMRRWPRLMSSMAVSLLPTPLSPTSKMPSP